MAIVADTGIYDSVHFIAVRTAARAIAVELLPSVDVAALTMSDMRDGAALEIVWHFRCLEAKELERYG